MGTGGRLEGSQATVLAMDGVLVQQQTSKPPQPTQRTRLARVDARQADDRVRLRENGALDDGEHAAALRPARLGLQRVRKWYAVGNGGRLI